MTASASALPTPTLSNVMYSALGSSIRRSYAMTGTPASLAFWMAGRTALVSCARTIRTFAPCEIRESMSVACCSLLRLASASMYLPPAASTVCWMAGLSCAAQRGCWKLFHDTPTVQPLPAAADELADAPALSDAAALADSLAGAWLAALGAVVAVPPPPHAATRIAVTPATVASFLIPMRDVLLLVTDWSTKNRWYRRVGYIVREDPTSTSVLREDAPGWCSWAAVMTRSRVAVRGPAGP